MLLNLTKEQVNDLLSIIECNEEERGLDSKELKKLLSKDTLNEIIQYLNVHKEYLNEKDEDGNYQFFDYMSEMNQAGLGANTPLEAIEMVDLDNTDFNIGFEQGFLRGIESVINLLKDNKSDNDIDIEEKEAEEQARVDDEKNYDLDIYLKIVSWYTNQYTNIDNQVGDLSLSIGDSYYVSIGYDSEGDINVQHYGDPDHEQDIDGGGLVDMSDMSDFIESLDGRGDINGSELLVLKEFIEKKSDFIYELSVS